MPMKIFTYALLALASTAHATENLCPINEQIEPEFRVLEHQLNEESALRAMDYLQLVVQGKEHPGEWLTLPNNLKLIEGYVLRREALKTKSERDISDFCLWLEQNGFWYE